MAQRGKKSNVSDDEKTCVVSNTDLDSFVIAYREKFGDLKNSIEILKLWSRRSAFKKELAAKKLQIPFKSITVQAPVRKLDDYPDVGETLVNISNKLSEFIVLAKEISDAQRKQLEVQTNTYELFRKLDKSKDEPKTGEPGHEP